MMHNAAGSHPRLAADGKFPRTPAGRGRTFRGCVQSWCDPQAPVETASQHTYQHLWRRQQDTEHIEHGVIARITQLESQMSNSTIGRRTLHHSRIRGFI
jgi:hypothetical protein